MRRKRMNRCRSNNIPEGIVQARISFFERWAVSTLSFLSTAASASSASLSSLSSSLAALSPVQSEDGGERGGSSAPRGGSFFFGCYPAEDGEAEEKKADMELDGKPIAGACDLLTGSSTMATTEATLQRKRPTKQKGDLISRELLRVDGVWWTLGQYLPSADLVHLSLTSRGFRSRLAQEGFWEFLARMRHPTRLRWRRQTESWKSFLLSADKRAYRVKRWKTFWERGGYRHGVQRLTGF